MKKVLMIAYHYPPMRGSSGIQRALRFSQYLREFGWEPIILTVQPQAYQDTSADQLQEIPPGMIVERAFALDTSRHLAFRGRYPRFLAIPDRWVSWWLSGVPAGMRLIREHRPSLIWSTYPIATAHKIGLSLQKKTGLPWVADFRDPMAQPDYPTDPRLWHAYKRIETDVLTHCAAATFTTPGAMRAYAETYPASQQKLHLLENGYDEEVFSRAQANLGPVDSASGPLRLLHSGIVYTSERDPRALFQAMSELKREQKLDASRLRLILRATGNDDYIQSLLVQNAIADLVELAPAVGYQQALAEMLSVDGLLVLQAANCNNQIPAKIYEYLRARRPILALTDQAGDTAGVLRAAGVDTLAPLDDVAAIKRALLAFAAKLQTGDAPLASEASIAAASRQGRTQELAQLFDQLVR